MMKIYQALKSWAAGLLGPAQKLEKIDLNVLLEEILEDLDHLNSGQREKIKVSKMPIIRTFRLRMKRLLTRLIISSLKYAAADKFNSKIESGVSKKIFTLSIRNTGMALSGKSTYEQAFRLPVLRKATERLGGKITVQKLSNEDVIWNIELPAKSCSKKTVF